MPRYTKAEQEEAKATLKENYLKQGDTINLVLQSVSRSGMSRTIKCFVTDENGTYNISRLVARAIGWSYVDNSYMDGVRAGGCGMDMGLHLVDVLSYALYGLPINQDRKGKTENDLTHGLRYNWL